MSLRTCRKWMKVQEKVFAVSFFVPDRCQVESSDVEEVGWRCVVASSKLQSTLFRAGEGRTGLSRVRTFSGPCSLSATSLS